MSNGEMAVNIFSKLPKSRVQLVGLEGTAGSISMNGGTVALPCVTFEHTIAQSWDPATNAVQVEANGARVGGLLPDVPIERTVENLHAFVAHRAGDSGTADVELAHARAALTALMEKFDGSVWAAPATAGQVVLIVVLVVVGLAIAASGCYVAARMQTRRAVGSAQRRGQLRW